MHKQLDGVLNGVTGVGQQFISVQRVVNPEIFPVHFQILLIDVVHEIQYVLEGIVDDLFNQFSLLLVSDPIDPVVGVQVDVIDQQLI